MSKKNKTKSHERLIWLLDTLYKAGPDGLDRKQVSEKWMKNMALSGGVDYPEKTFHNHIKKIREVFHVDIERVGHIYCIQFENNMGLSALSMWLECIQLKNVIGENKELRKRIYTGKVYNFNKRIQHILSAIENTVEIVIKYNKTHYTVRPYMLGNYWNRWYLVGECDRMDGIYFFLLSNLSIDAITDNEFIMPPVNPDFCDDAKFLRYLNIQHNKNK